jgi:hypothetical protein
VLSIAVLRAPAPAPAPASTSASSSFSQKPRRDQRLNRLQTVVDGPYSPGQSHQRHPTLSTCKMPEITRRSSTRLAPGWFLGRCGSIVAHASSDSQKEQRHAAPFLIHISVDQESRFTSSL